MTSKQSTKNPVGRPRNSGPDVLPIFDSMRAVYGATGIPIHIQKRAKAAGCNAFRGGRVYLADLLRWIFETDADDDTSIDWDRRWRKARAQIEELNLSKEKGLVATREWFGKLLLEVATKQRAILAAHVTPEVLGKICTEMQSLAAQFPKDGGMK
jgi:hypothetical protein